MYTHSTHAKLWEWALGGGTIVVPFSWPPTDFDTTSGVKGGYYSSTLQYTIICVAASC